MGELTVGWLASGQQGTKDSRLATQGTLTPGESALRVRAGFVPFPGAAELTGTGAMTASLSPCQAWVPGTVNADQGVYPVTLPAMVELTFDPGEDAVDRRDRVVLHVADPVDNTAVHEGTVEIVRGDSATGNPGALPPNTLKAWLVTVPAGASAATGGIPWDSALTDERQLTVALGGMLPASNAELATIPHPYRGQMVYNTDGDHLEVHDGSVWHAVSIPTLTSGEVIRTVDGLMVYNIPDRTVYTYNADAGAFEVYLPPQLPRGSLAFTHRETNSDEISQTEVMYVTSPPVDVVAGRRYSIHTDVTWVGDKDEYANASFHCRWAPGDTVTTAGAEIGSTYTLEFATKGATHPASNTWQFAPAVTQTITIGIGFEVTGTGAGIGACTAGTLEILDVGLA